MRPRRQDVEPLLRGFFAAHPDDIVAAYLFGSVARERPRAGSDVDLGLLYAREPPPTLEGLPLDPEAELERLLGCPTQVVALNRAPVDLVHRVLRDGRLMLETDRAARIRFEVKARNEYFDILPLLERYRRLPGAR
jgi:predicted nucleotidyltransferase